MNLNKPSRGGARDGAGRPKKRKNELQKTHSIRATDKDWEEIKRVVRRLKGKLSKDKRPCCFILSKEEEKKVSSFLLEGAIDKWHEAKWGKPEPPAPKAPKKVEPVEIETPQSTEEERAVSFFLSLYRLNPAEAEGVVKSHLEKEQRIRDARVLREAQAKLETKIDEDSKTAFSNADDVNARIEQMLANWGNK